MVCGPAGQREGRSGRGRRGCTRQREPFPGRHAGHVLQQPAARPHPTHHRELRLGCRAAAPRVAASHRATRRRLLHGRQEQGQGGRLEIHRIRQLPERSGNRGAHGPHRAVAALGRRVGCLPRPHPKASQQPGLARRRAHPANGSGHVQLARDRRRRQQRSRAGVLWTGHGRRGGGFSRSAHTVDVRTRPPSNS